jgi:putative cardiolipin synthase
MSLFGSRGASLHTKAFVIDGCSGFIGSFNFDPRSATLNSEMGLLFEHEELAAEMLRGFADEISPARSYRVVLKDGRIAWQDAAGECPHLLLREPAASIRRRLVAWIISMLPIESQL